MANSLFNLSPRSTRERDNSLARKTNSRRSQSTAGITLKGGQGLLSKVQTIVATVNSKLGKYKDVYEIINDESVLQHYIETAIKNGVISIDTETTSLDPLTTTIAGACIFTPGLKGAYVPINHVSYITGIRSKNQLSEEVVSKQLKKLENLDMEIEMFNADFDTRVLKHTLKVELICTWDAYIGARLLNETSLKMV